MSKKKIAATMAEEPAEETVISSPEATPAGKKRKVDDVPEDEKLEIDVSLPEPPSKKAKRAEKKKSKTKTPTTEVSETAKAFVKEYNTEGNAAQPNGTTGTEPAKRSEFGIWIGNLPFSATKESLRQFMEDQGDIDGKAIVRLHMPVPPVDKNDRRPMKPQNKGFAYVDFTSQTDLDAALALSEKLMTGRRVLIKNAKSFEGRPEKAVGAAADSGAAGGIKPAGRGEKEPAKRIFVGNLSFDVTRDDLDEHFSLAGEIEDIHMATFEDSGKCKGFAWVRFKEVEAAEAAVRGFVYRKADDDEDESESDDADVIVDNAADAGGRKKKAKAKPRRHKQHINMLHGRELRREFAEDSQTRYKKRFGKEKPHDGPNPHHRGAGADTASAGATATADGTENFDDLVQAAAAERGYKGPKPVRSRGKPDADQRRDVRRKKHEDARNIAPGKALAGAQRNTGAIVAGKGKKMTFE